MTRRLSSNQKITILMSVASLVIGVGGLATAIIAAKNAADTSALDVAVSRLTALAAQTKRQADASQSEVEALNKQAIATANLVGPARTSARVAINGLREQQRDFLLDQRPIISEDYADLGFNPDPVYDDARKQYEWSYAYKNQGKAAAIDVTVDEALSIRNKPFHSNRRHAKQILPGEEYWSTATIPGFLDRQESTVDLKYTLLIDIKYRDAAGNKYETTICRRRIQVDVDMGCDPKRARRLGMDHL